MSSGVERRDTQMGERWASAALYQTLALILFIRNWHTGNFHLQIKMLYYSTEALLLLHFQL